MICDYCEKNVDNVKKDNNKEKSFKNKYLNFEPHRRNRFKITIKSDKFSPEYWTVTKFANYPCDTMLYITIMETEGVCLPEILHEAAKNKTNFTISKNILTASGNIEYTVVYIDCNIDDYLEQDLNYSNDDTLQYTIKFKYKDVKITKTPKGENRDKDMAILKASNQMLDEAMEKAKKKLQGNTELLEKITDMVYEMKNENLDIAKNDLNASENEINNVKYNKPYPDLGKEYIKFLKNIDKTELNTSEDEKIIPCLYDFVDSHYNKAIIAPKLNEICNKLAENDRHLFIKKTRACGMTHILFDYMMWLSSYRNQENNTIWYIAPSPLCCDAKDKFIELLKENNIDYIDSRYNILWVKGWKIYFIQGSTSDIVINRTMGTNNPHVVILDEEIYSDGYENILGYLKSRGIKRIVNVYSDRNDELNCEVSFIDDKQFISVNWFHDITKCAGLRFENTIHGVDNTLRIDSREDVERVVSNLDYIRKMYLDGWTLTSDYISAYTEKMVEVKKTVPDAVTYSLKDGLKHAINYVVENYYKDNEEVETLVKDFMELAEKLDK